MQHLPIDILSFLYSFRVIMDAQKVSGSSCTCAASNQMRVHTTKPEMKRTNKSLTTFPCSDCHCPSSSIKHTRRHAGIECSHRYHLHMDKISYLYFSLCILCMVTSSVSLENIIIEDQQTQVGRLFYYNISLNKFPLKDSSQLKVCH